MATRIETFLRATALVSLSGFEKLLLSTHGGQWWFILVLAGLALAWVTQAGSLSLGTMALLYCHRLSSACGKTPWRRLAIISVATLLCISIGIPLGIWMAKVKSRHKVSHHSGTRHVMQTIPSFVYLIPVVMLLGIGKVPGLIAVCIYAIPPIVRLTNLGIRLVDKEVLEAADAFGADYRQRLFGVQIPLALPNIFAGVNQTIMMSLAMVVIASMIGVKGSWPVPVSAGDFQPVSCSWSF